MKELQRTSIYKNLFLGLIMAYLLASLSPWWNLMPPLAVILFLATLFYHKPKTSIKLIYSNKASIAVFSSLFFAGLIGMTYTSNKVDGWMDVILKASFLLFPLIFILLPQEILHKNELKRILSTFILIVFGSSIYCFLMALANYGSTSQESVFYYTQLSFFMHPSYFGLFINLALIIIFYRWIHQEEESQNKKVKLIFLLMLPWFIVFLFLLQSKASLISLLILIGLFFFYQLFYQKKYKSALKFIGALMLIVSLSALIIPGSIHRFKSASEAINSEEHQAKEKESTAARMTLWKVAIEAIKEGSIWGTGTGDVEKTFNDRLLNKGFVEEGDTAYNSHSQYLQSTMKLGLLGFVALLAMLLYPMWHAYKKKNVLYFGLILLMAFNLLVEGMFERQAGVMFFAFFNSLFYYGVLKENAAIKEIH